MKADVDRGPQRAAMTRLATLSAKIRALVDAARAAPPAQAGLALRRLALALRAQLDIDERLLRPALAELQADRAARELGGRRVELLRDLAGLVGEPGLSPVSRQHMLCVLEGVWMLHDDALADALAQHAALLPWRLLRDDIDALLSRWEATLAAEPAISGRDDDDPGR